MKELLQQYAAYNSWANQKLFECILSLSEEELTKEFPSSFSTIRTTLLHMWDAESIWWQRMKLQESISRPSGHFKGNTRDVVVGLQHQNKLWETWIAGASPAALEHVFMYYDSKREPIKLGISTMLMQVFNHGTYHRGQLVNMLRQAGVEKIPGTDFFLWSRRRG